MSRLAIVAMLSHVAAPSSPDEFASHSRFYRLDPRVKVISAVVFAVAVSLITQLLPLAIALLTAFLLLAVSGLKLRALSRQFRIIVPLLIVIALPVYFFKDVEAFVAMLLRISAATIVLLVMVLTTASADLSNGLRRLGLPRILVSMFAMTYRYIFLYGEEARRMSRARESRGQGWGKSLRDRRVLQTISSTAGLILVKAFKRATRIQRAMMARGYSGEAVGARRLRMTLPDGALLAVISGLVVILLLMNWGVVLWM